jgi:sulfoxide reductase heme-binding subunit YedZ
MVLLARLRARWLRLLVHVGALLPFAWTIWQYWQGLFLVDPVQEITTRTGRTALILLVLTLACTPLHTLFNFKRGLQLQRTLGLYTFLYVSLHFATFVWLDYGFDLSLLQEAIFAQRYVVVGFAAGLILLVLAITSTQGWQRRLGRNWKRLHRLIYLASVLAVVHYAWLVKDLRGPLRYGVVVALLLVLRIPRVRKALSRTRSWLVKKVALVSEQSS